MEQKSTLLSVPYKQTEYQCYHCKSGKIAMLLFWVYRLDIYHYDSLLNFGWFRFYGCLWRPIYDKTCCPPYQFRLDVHRFQLSRSQKRVLRNMLEYLKFDRKPKQKSDSSDVYKNDFNSMSQKCFNNKPIEKEVYPNKKVKIDRPCEKKKNSRKRRALEKLLKKGVDIEQYQLERVKKEEARRRTIESFLLPYAHDWKHKLEIRIIKKGTQEFKQTIEEVSNIFVKYQNAVHDETRSREILEEKFITNPFINNNDDGISPTLGAYQQHYLLDGRIIAVGIIDILPSRFKSDYFFYDPDYSFLSLGTYSVLSDIAFVRQLAKNRPNLHYYELGYYISNIKKLAYKANFRPSELLCPYSLQWVPLSECKHIIESSEGKFVKLRSEASSIHVPEILDVKCLHKASISNYNDISLEKEKAIELDEKLQEYVKYAGDLATEMVLYIRE